MWHIVLIGYVFTTMMFALAQPGIARKLIYLMFFTVLPTVFSVWVALVRRRNRLMKLEDARQNTENRENRAQ
ncbi:hypothetical protein [Conchiformibius kuhniae]|uniref:Uncharacterized protein n=1 Tax=Conchiformibius kuhniae TaxID=211502 RepID=A0A8T9MSE1_9NEIS|nr:hypothetical protein [Conchiformibius kuhniae]UOP04527.1 hypothetical protein LVJ77_09650 [Conchiformibius kuhniae]